MTCTTTGFAREIGLWARLMPGLVTLRLEEMPITDLTSALARFAEGRPRVECTETYRCLASLTALRTLSVRMQVSRAICVGLVVEDVEMLVRHRVGMINAGGLPDLGEARLQVILPSRHHDDTFTGVAARSP